MWLQGWDWLSWSEHGADNTKVVGSVLLRVIHLKVGPEDPCGSFPIQSIWCSVNVSSFHAKVCKLIQFQGYFIVSAKNSVSKEQFIAVR